jgi:predicted aldo/keto reductase-like oxidoreductase
MADLGYEITRRGFIRQSAASVAVVSLAGSLASCSTNTEYGLSSKTGNMPMRVLGKTGLEVSILSFGGGSQFLRNDDGDWEPIMAKALESGINYFDTSSDYERDDSILSEERYGRILPPYRNKLIIATKFNSRDAAGAREEVEESLRRMKTDYVDIILIHSIGPDDNIAAIEKGCYREMVRMKDEGIARFIGFSSMDSAPKSKELLDKLEVDVAMLALNPTQYGDFAKLVMPVTRRRNVGVVAMKLMRDIVGKEATAAELFNYALTEEGVATATIAHTGMRVLDENIRLATEFEAGKQVAAKRKQLEQKLVHLAHSRALCWAQPNYFDGKMC